jgi:penicillin amidase
LAKLNHIISLFSIPISPFMKFLKRLLISVVALALLVIGGIFIYLQYLHPDRNAVSKLPGLKDKVEVLYDNYGIPHIYASNEEDLMYAFGYVHAQDRLFQMEILRRLADGRLSELFGEKALDSDKFFRTLSFRQQAKWTIDSMYKDDNAPLVKAAKAYVNGVNHFISNGKTPIEFTIAGIPKTPFTLEDMEIITGYMGYTFVGAFKTESIASLIYSKLGKSYYDDVLSQWPDSSHRIPVNAGGSDSTLKVLGQLSAFVSSLENDLPFPPFYGSNGWVISGKKTKSGKPLLSNDTHIEFAQPSVWYEAHLECPDLNIYGSFLAGVPFPALGHNLHGGWGITMFENDDADLYREKLHPDNPGQVWYKDHWEDLKIRPEIIKVKDAPDVVLNVKRSRHGYLMNEVLKETRDIKEPIALWWVYHQFPSQHASVFYNLCRAKNAADAGRAVAPLTSPGLNFMWGDTGGNIAWWAAGRLPVRPVHVDPQIILDGSTGANDPIGWLDFSQNPQILNPERGVIYTANNQPADMGTGLVAGYYVPSDRAERIEEILYSSKNDWTEEDSRAMINDVKATSYSRLLKAVLPVMEMNVLTPDAKRDYELLMKWDGSHDLEDIEPTIYYRFLYHVYQNTLHDELGKETSEKLQYTLSFRRNAAALLMNDASSWWDVTGTTIKETRSQILTRSLNEASNWLVTQMGEDRKGWAWKKVHTLEHKHPLGIIPLIGKYFNVGPIPVPGGRETLNNLEFRIDSSGKYPVRAGPALRRIIDFGNPERAYSVNPTGQSGYFMSKHYKDQAAMFAEGGKRPELMNRKDIEKMVSGRLILHP